MQLIAGRHQETNNFQKSEVINTGQGKLTRLASFIFCTMQRKSEKYLWSLPSFVFMDCACKHFENCLGKVISLVKICDCLLFIDKESTAAEDLHWMTGAYEQILGIIWESLKRKEKNKKYSWRLLSLKTGELEELFKRNMQNKCHMNLEKIKGESVNCSMSFTSLKKFSV